MLTRILVALLLFLVPFLLYLSYVRMRRRVAGKLASEEMMPWLMLTLSGLVAATVGIIGIGVMFDHGTDVQLRPPAFVDGELVPGGPVE